MAFKVSICLATGSKVEASVWFSDTSMTIGFYWYSLLRIFESES